MIFKSLPIGQVKAGTDDGLEDGEMIAYASTFTREPDSYGDVIAKGAFADTIAAWKASGDTLPVLYGHRFDDPDYFVGGVVDMEEDDHGWKIRAKFDLESPKALQVYRLVKGRRLSQLSFAFDIEDSGEVELEDGRKAQELRKLKVYEASVVPVGANQDTSVVAVKSAIDGFKAGRVLAVKHLDTLRAAQDALGEVIKAAEGEDANSDANGATDNEDKTGIDEAQARKSTPASPEVRSTPSVDLLAAQAHIYALTAQEEGSK